MRTAAKSINLISKSSTFGPAEQIILWRNCRICSPTILLLVFLFAFIFFHCHSFSSCWPHDFSCSHRSYEILMFFFQRNSSLLFLITRSSSFYVIHVKVDIKNNVEKRLVFFYFFPLKVLSGHEISSQKKYELHLVCHTC